MQKKKQSKPKLKQKQKMQKKTTKTKKTKLTKKNNTKKKNTPKKKHVFAFFSDLGLDWVLFLCFLCVCVFVFACFL